MKKIYAAIGHWNGSKDLVSIAYTQNTKANFMRDCYGNGFVPYVVLTETILKKIFEEGADVFEQVKKLTTNYRVWLQVTSYLTDAGYILLEQIEEIKNTEQD